MIVTSLFVEVETYIGEDLFTADTTLETVDTTLITADRTIIGAGGYASEYQRVELYKDDPIKITSSVQNYKDISTVTTDYSQTFTIPASKVNNKIFSYWYENLIDGGFDHRIRYKAFIEIDGVLFRQGNIQMEKANRNNGYIENYYITFYGDLVQLNELFKEDKLQIVFNTAIGVGLNHPYFPNEVIDRATGISSADVLYPIIGSNDRYEYMTGTVYDITTVNSIKWDDLFPAVKVSTVFNMIQEYYGITFTGTFLSYQQFTKLFLYLKNAEELTIRSEEVKVSFTSIATQLSLPRTVWLNGIDNIPFRTITPVTSTSIITPVWIIGQYNNEKLRWRLTITPNLSTVNYDVIVKKNGQIVNVFYENLGTQTLTLRPLQTWLISEIDDKYEFFIQSADNILFTSNFEYTAYGISPPFVTPYFSSFNATGVSQSTSTNISIINFVPDITVSDFFTGILKLFNILVIPTGANSYELIPTELYYASGRNLDLTKYFYADTMEAKKPQLFKQIEFKYETSDNILNNRFRGLFDRDYGDLLYNNENFSDNETNEVGVPFENVMFEKNSINYNFLTATIWDKDEKPYTPQPILLYNNFLTILNGNPIRFDTGVGIVTRTIYGRFSNEYPTSTDLSQILSLNFGSEISPFYLTVASQSLYQRHYSAYIENLYDIKTRIVNIKAKLDAPTMANIKLNDQIFIRDKRYTINTMTVDLTTGETDFELLTNLRPADSASSIGNRASTPFLFLDKTSQTVQMELYLLNNLEFELLEPYAGSPLIYDASKVQRQDYVFEFTIPANLTLDVRSEYLEVIYTTKTGEVQNFKIQIIQDI